MLSQTLKNRTVITGRATLFEFLILEIYDSWHFVGVRRIFNTPMKQTENSDQTPSLPRLAFNINETAEILGVSIATVRRWIKGGLLKCSWASRHKLIPLAEIERFLRDTLE